MTKTNETQRQRYRVRISAGELEEGRSGVDGTFSSGTKGTEMFLFTSLTPSLLVQGGFQNWEIGTSFKLKDRTASTGTVYIYITHLSNNVSS